MTNDPGQGNPPSRPLPLDYHRPTAQRRSGLRSLLGFLGFIVGAACIAFAGTLLYSVVPHVSGPYPSSPVGNWWIGGGLAVIAALSIVGAVWSIRKRHAVGWALLAGLLIGVALMGLVEGYCFGGGG